MAIDIKLSYSNLTKEEHLPINLLRDDTSIVVKEADKGLVVVVLDREDFLNHRSC